MCSARKQQIAQFAESEQQYVAHSMVDQHAENLLHTAILADMKFDE